VNIVKDCNCQGIPSKCRRRKRFVTYFEGSSFEQTVDVGECMGGCSGFGLSKLAGYDHIQDGLLMM